MMLSRRTSPGSRPLRLSFLFKSCGLWTLSCVCAPFIETLAQAAAHLKNHPGGDNVARYSLPPPGISVLAPLMDIVLCLCPFH